MRPHVAHAVNQCDTACSESSLAAGPACQVTEITEECPAMKAVVDSEDLNWDDNNEKSDEYWEQHDFSLMYAAIAANYKDPPNKPKSRKVRIPKSNKPG